MRAWASYVEHAISTGVKPMPFAKWSLLEDSFRTKGLRKHTPVNVYPGEDELQALAEGALRVLRGEEEVRELS